MQTGYGRSKRRAAAGWIGLVAGVLAVLAAGAAPAAPAKFDFLVVSEDEPWTAAVAAPVAALQRVGGQTPLLIALGTPPTREAEQLVELAAPKHPLVLAATTEPKLGRALERCTPEVMAIGSDPVRGSLLVAKRFWGRPRQVVVAATEDAEGILFGAALAARLSIPLLLCERTESRAALGRALEDLGVEEALAAVADADHAPLWATARGTYNIKILGPARSRTGWSRPSDRPASTRSWWRGCRRSAPA